MKVSVHDISTGTFVPMLRSLSQIFDKGWRGTRAASPPSMNSI